MNADACTLPDQPPVLIDRRGHAGVITLNRPRALNALTHEMVAIMSRTLAEWAGDPTISTVVLAGSGDRGLCAGGDIVAIYEDARTGGTGTEDFWRDEYDLNALIAEYPKPYVAFMDGIVLGGGVGVSAHASHRVVTERTRIGMPETGIGFVPDVGGTWLLSHAPGELGTYVALTAGHLDAGDALETGLADHFVHSGDLDALLDLLGAVSADEALREVARARPPSALADQRDWIDECFGHEDVAGIVQALSTSGAPAAAVALEAVSSKSPTALAVTLRALRTARSMSGLTQALDQEYRIAVRMLRGHDFPEGIRAQVIDKDRTPHWKPATVDDVDPEDVDAYFAPLGAHD
ncbi:3-hydroxyisobutyryl-CoA hydrolase [Nocardioides gansuensis]|uniref:3-hydroxyisobutyryl-CoA hydrolase n=1 Tax=Nocardioides gansuensis TaxID=2138300 RepID=A0A2T8FCY3_9ACTN|nr:enoyl-CoA hydratase/isomerase family protein [Nocardioides gansuensis]PVG83571.1 3-hydroxyisobutyryl-CoA hydrolase [Nocardioides gansuensis]